MKVATAEQIQELDRKTIESYRIPGIVLMENAGRGATEVLVQTFPDLPKKRIAVIAGKGKNGGDGFVIARYLMNQGISARVYLLTDPKALRGDGEINYHIFLHIKGEVIPVPSSKDYQKLKKDLEKFDLLIDGIFGTGLDAEVRGYYREVITHLNTLGKTIVSIDIPSGLDANTGITAWGSREGLSYYYLRPPEDWTTGFSGSRLCRRVKDRRYRFSEKTAGRGKDSGYSSGKRGNKKASLRTSHR